MVFSVVAACAFSACAKQKTVPAESITFSETSYTLDSRQTLEKVCTAVPENATVKVCSAADESISGTCEVTVKAPANYTTFSDLVYCKFVYPMGWAKTFYSDTGLTIFTDSVTGANISIIKETPNDICFKAKAAFFKDALTNTYMGLGYTVTGMQCSASKENHLGNTCVHVVYDYTLNSEPPHQEQMILNSNGKTCVLTMTFVAAAINKDILNTVFFEFVGINR